jgi:ATP-dependent Clp protease ATP-binding subunit ClpA
MAGTEGTGQLMFERFTAESKTVVKQAREASRAGGRRHVGTEHLLIALLRPEAGGAARVLANAGLNAQQVSEDIDRIFNESGQHLGETDAAALEAIGIDLNAVRAKLEETFGPGALEPEVEPTRYGLFGRRFSGGPFTPRSKKVLELSLREALRLKHNFIGPEHILLGLIREGQGLAAQVLAERGVDFDELRGQAEASLRVAA